MEKYFVKSGKPDYMSVDSDDSSPRLTSSFPWVVQVFLDLFLCAGYFFNAFD